MRILILAIFIVVCKFFFVPDEDLRVVAVHQCADFTLYLFISLMPNLGVWDEHNIFVFFEITGN